MASQDSLQFFARTVSQQGKGEKSGGGGSKIPYLPSPFPSLFFKQNNKTKQKTGETEQMLKNRFLKITVNQS